MEYTIMQLNTPIIITIIPPQIFSMLILVILKELLFAYRKNLLHFMKNVNCSISLWNFSQGFPLLQVSNLNRNVSEFVSA